MLTSLASEVIRDRTGSPPPMRLLAPDRTMGSCVPAPVGPRPVKERDRRNEDGRERLLGRVRGEFMEMPCMRVTCEEAARLFGLREDVCTRILADLVRAGDIRRAPDGRYSRLVPTV